MYFYFTITNLMSFLSINQYIMIVIIIIMIIIVGFYLIISDIIIYNIKYIKSILVSGSKLINECTVLFYICAGVTKNLLLNLCNKSTEAIIN